jgi:DNA-binding SARP family transcriptional activator
MTATAAEDSEDIDQDQVFNAPRPRLVEDDPGVRREPDRIDIGERNGRPISWSLSDLAGVTLSGSDALGVVRAWASALLVRAGPIGAEVLLTASVLDRLAPGSVATTGIRLASTAPVLLETLEAEVLARSRQLNDAEATDATGYRLDHPWDPLPATLAVVDAIAPIDRARWLPILSDAHRLGLGVIEMDGTTDTKARIELDDSNVVVSATPERLSNEFKEARLFSLGPDELHDVLATLDFAEQRPDSSAADEDDELGPISVFTRIEPIDSDGQHAQPAADVEADTWPRLTAVGPTSESAITVDVLGSLQITVASEVVSSGLRTPAKELLLWYLLRPEGASVEAAVEQLWPDTEPERVHKQFWIGASNLRTRLGAVADPPTKLLLQSGEIYRLDLDALGSDLWEFQAALDKAARSDDEALAGEWLRRAVECCRGEPFSGLDFPWIEPVRQDVHRRIVDAHLRLSEIEIRLEKPDAAVSVLEDVIEFDRYAEEPYRRLMTLQHDMGRSDALEATWRLLKDRLAEIDVDIERATLQLYRHLCAEETSQRDHQRVST